MGFLGLGKGKAKNQGGNRAAGAQSESDAPAASAVKSTAGAAQPSSRVRKGDTAPMPTRPSRKVVAVTKSHEAPKAATAQRGAVASAVETGDELDLMSDIPAAKTVTKSTTAKKTGIAAALGHSGPARTGDQALQQFLTQTSKLITADQFNTLKAKADADGVPYDVAGVALKLFTEDQLVSGLTTLCYVPNLKLDKYGIRKKALDTVSMEDAQRCGVIPVDKLGSLLTLAMVNPLDAETVRAIEAKTGLEVKKVVAPRSEIVLAIDRYYNGKVEAKDVTLSFSAEPSQEVKSVQQLLGNVKEAPTASSRPAAQPKSISATQDIPADIQDIDDLLAEEEVIAPEIIEPLRMGDGESASFQANPLVVPPEDVLDLPGAALERRQERPNKPSEVLPTSSPTTRTTLPQALPDSGGGPKEHQTGAALVRIPVVDLVPVLEDEFRYAITHGKAHVFEKWVGLQTRNRVINPIPVDQELGKILDPLFAA